MATLLLALLLVPLPTAIAMTPGRTNCSTLCGTNEISYPFGIGTECSMPGFNLSCVPGADNTSTLLLGNPPVVIDANSPNISTGIAYLVKMTPGVRDYYTAHWEAPGRPFAISGSSGMSLFVVGCGAKASLFAEDSDDEVGSCSAICAGDEIMEHLSERVPCDVGVGCCSIDIKVNLRAFTLNISRISRAARVLEEVNAFITDRANYLFHESDLQRDLTGRYYKATLGWSIPYQPDCKHAMEDRASYACYNNSRCQDSPIGGYFCNCEGGFSGDPYVVNGCVVQEEHVSSSELR